MFKDNREDIYERLDKYMPLSLFGPKINVGIVGGGRASFIKTKFFINNNANVEVLSKDFINEFISIKSEKFTLLKGEYKTNFILDKHIIIIAIDDKDTINKIRQDCLEYYKIFISSYDYKDGMGVIPVYRETKSSMISVNSKVGNPKGAIMLSNKIIDLAKEYDDFIIYSAKLRQRVKYIKENKDEILHFIVSEDFKYFYEKGREIYVLRLFYDEDIVNQIIL